MNKKYKSKAARDAQKSNYGNKDYWNYLDESAQDHSNYYKNLGDNKKAKEMLTQSLSEALKGNEGN